MALTNTSYGGYLAKVRGSESGGDKNAKNPRSSASGLYQFTKGTWEGLGYDWRDRFNTDLQTQAMSKLTSNNANYLKSKLGIDPTDADLYGSHFLGPARYSSVYKASSNTPLSDILSSGEISANPFLKGKTAGYLKGWLSNKMGKEVSPTDYEDSYNYGVNDSLNLPTSTGEYVTAPELTSATSKEDLEAEQAKAELTQKQQEKNFLAEIKAQQEQAAQARQQQDEQQQPQEAGIDESYYQIPQIALPEYQAPQQIQEPFRYGGEMKKYEDGGNTSNFDDNSARDWWVRKTGKSWEEARKLGYSDGTSSSNIKLLSALKDKNFTLDKDNTKVAQRTDMKQFKGFSQEEKNLMQNKQIPVTRKTVAIPVAKAKKELKEVDTFEKTMQNNLAAKGNERKLQNGVITDKRTNTDYVVQGGKIIKSFPVLTAVNPDVNVNDKGVAYLEDHPESKSTPRGTYILDPRKDIYGEAGFRLQPVPAFGEAAPKAKDIATHVTYPGDFEERNPLYTQIAKNRYASYGCINCRKPDINYLTDRFKKGDTTMVIDSKIKRDANFLAKKLFSRK